MSKNKHVEGVILTKLKQIHHAKGDIYHAMKCSDAGYVSFGEAYFSTIHYSDIKGWKKHNKMTLNLIVPVGEVEFVIFDGRTNFLTYNNFCVTRLSQNNYMRLTIPPQVWVAFRGLNKGVNLLLNIASVEHDPDESVSCELKDIAYQWSKL